MAYGIVHQFAGGTEDQYRASIAAVHPSEGRLPEGQVFHAAGESDDGWVIVAIHESKESWEKVSRWHADAPNAGRHRRWCRSAPAGDSVRNQKSGVGLTATDVKQLSAVPIIEKRR